MPDYTRATGSSGTMMIRDTGTNVEFWLRAGSSTFAYDLPWGYTVNGATDNSNEFRFESGGAWQRLAVWAVSTTQTVTFRLYATGTGGLGGPTTHTATINRASLPGPASAPVLSSITSSGMFVEFTGGAPNGSPIIAHQIAWNTAPTPLYSAFSDGSTYIGGLLPATKYYFWARSQNAVGWGPWGARREATTYAAPAAPSNVTLSNVTQFSVTASFTPNGNGGSAITGYEIGYGTSPTAPTTVVASTGTTVITNLLPGTTYYFWARAQNAWGWSPYSAAPGIAKTVAGAWVKVGLTYKAAIPYVKVAGVWRPARAWGKSVGYWIPSS